MAMVDYDSLAGILRITDAGSVEPDRFVTDVITYHAALELEVDFLLSRMLPRYEKLSTLRGYSNKIMIMNAAWVGSPESGDKLFNALLLYNELRNSVAHNDSLAIRNGHYGRLLDAYREIESDPKETATPHEVAISICAFMGDDTVSNLVEMMDMLDELINVRMPRTLGGQ